MPRTKKDTTKTLEVPAAMTKLLESCLKTYHPVNHEVTCGRSRALGQVRPTCKVLELLRRTYSAANDLFLAVATLYEPLNGAVPLVTTEVPPPPVVKQPSLSGMPCCALAVCPRCGAIVLAVDATDTDLRRRMTDEAYSLKRICTRALPSPRLRSTVVAYLRALDLTKLTPENLDFLHRLRSALGELLVALFDWIKPLQDVLIAADELDRNPSELPSFVISAAGPIDVQRRQPCEHLVDIGLWWSLPVYRRGWSSRSGRVEWLRPAGCDVFGCASGRMEKQQVLTHGYERLGRRKKYPAGRVTSVRFCIDGDNKDERPVGFETYGYAYFIDEEQRHHR